MKLTLLSDVHVEFDNDVPSINPEATLVVLAGDIHRHVRGIDVANELNTWRQVPVIVLAGNHEFYRAEIDGLLVEMRKRAGYCRDIHFLERDSVVIDGVRFLGCTLWSDFSINGPEQIRHHMRIAQQRVNDFHLIRYRGKLFKPEDAAALYKESYAWLEAELKKPFAGKTVVVTHFAPHRAAIHPRYLQNGVLDALTPYFVTDCSALMRSYSIDAWLYGHTHHSVDVLVENGTRLVSNQRGYPDEPLTYTHFDPQKIIDI